MTKKLHEYIETPVEILLMEECAELTQALSKIIRYGFTRTHKDHLYEEIADVILTISMLEDKHDLDKSMIQDMIRYKQDRLIKRARLSDNGKAR